MTLGERLRKARERRGFTQMYVAKMTGISNTVLSNYERDYRAPDPETLAKLADLYGVSLDSLLGRSAPPKDDLDEEIKRILEDPDMNIFFKDLLSAPEERRREMMEIWEVLKKREAGRKPGQKQGE